MNRTCLLLLVAAVAVAAPAATATISGKLRLPASATVTQEDASKLLGGLQISLNGGQLSTTTHRNGEFTIFNVTRGHTYLLEIEHRELAWSTFKLQVPALSDDAKDAEPTISVLEYKYPGASKLPSSHPIIAFPVAQTVYFEQRPRMSVLSIFANPQMLIMLAMGGLMLCLPYLQKSVSEQAATDPALQATLNAQNQMASNPMGAILGMLRGDDPFGGAGANAGASASNSGSAVGNRAQQRAGRARPQ